MMSDPPEFPAPHDLVTHGQIRDLLKSACTIGRPNLILVHSADLVMALSLRELHTTACLRQLQVDLRDKLVKLSFCPFCAYVGGNDLSYLNHIIIAHYNASYGCGQCLKHAFISSLVLHTHKKVCLRFPSKKASRVPDSSGEQQWPWGFFQSHPQEGWQGDCCQLPGLEHHLSLSDFTTPQQTGNFSPQQVQEG